MNIKQFLNFSAKNKFSLIAGIAATVCAIVALVLYVKTGVTNFTVNKLDGALVAMLVIGVVVSVVTIVFDFKLVKFAGFIAILIAFMKFIVFEIDYIANIFTSIDPTPVTGAFIGTLVTLLVAVVCALLSAINCSDKLEAMVNSADTATETTTTEEN